MPPLLWVMFVRLRFLITEGRPGGTTAHGGRRPCGGLQVRMTHNLFPPLQLAARVGVFLNHQVKRKHESKHVGVPSHDSRTLRSDISGCTG